MSHFFCACIPFSTQSDRLIPEMTRQIAQTNVKKDFLGWPTRVFSDPETKIPTFAGIKDKPPSLKPFSTVQYHSQLHEEEFTTL